MTAGITLLRGGMAAVRGTEDCSASFIIRAADCVRTGRSCLRLSTSAMNAALGTVVGLSDHGPTLPNLSYLNIHEIRYVLAKAGL